MRSWLIKEFSTVMTFEAMGRQKTVLPRSVSFRIAGRAMLVKKIDKSVEVTFDDYRYVGD